MTSTACGEGLPGFSDNGRGVPRSWAIWPVRRAARLGDPSEIMTSVLAVALQPDVVSLRVRRAGDVDPGIVCGALAAPEWLGQPTEPGEAPPGMRRFLTDLVLPLDGRRLALRKAAFVDLGPPQPRPDGGCTVEVAWRSASLAPLFPVFAGRLVVGREGIRLEGQYAPPGGALGRAADRLLLHVAANGTARWFLDHLVSAIDS